jgi:ABC-type transporter Mla subunit MlaD
MNKIDNPATMQNYLGHSRQAQQMKNDSVKEHMPAESFDKLALNNRTAISMKIVFQSVSSQISARFEKSTYEADSKNTIPSSKMGTVPLADNEPTEGFFDFNKVAKTIMDFVGGSIISAKAGGASDEELKEMFEQGRAGANLGIDQAIGELKDLAMLDDGLNQGIEKSRDIVNTSLDDLYEQMFPTEKAPNTNIELETPNATKVKLDSELYASNSKSSDLTITTTDGDIVSISFSELQETATKERYQYAENEKGASDNYSMTGSQYHEVNFSYSVEGNLDDDEKAAIEALIKDVNSLQKDFFSGNVDQAFEKALELGFDNEQIANFSMDLQQTQTSYVSQTYVEVSEFDEKLLPNTNKELKPLIDFLDQFKQLQETAEKLLSKNDDTFGQLLNAVFKAEFGNDKEAKDKFDKVIETIKPKEVE